ncbi:MAG: ABC transporter ATP-binding protein [Oligoflexia bacterium]|nr:ABC transporter ATP-binding protein [Oligoflexia bacterium]
MSTSKTKWYNYFLFEGGHLFLALIFICLIISSALGLFVPEQIANLSRHYEVEAKFFETLKILGAIFVGVYLNRVVYQITVSTYMVRLMQNVRTLCYSRWLHAYEVQTETENNNDKFPQGEVIARIMSDTESLRELMTSGTFGILIDIFFVISCLVSFISLNTTSGVIISISEVIACIALVFGSKYMRKIFLSVRQARGDMSRTLANVVGGVNETYYNNHFNYASKKGEKTFDEFLDKILKSNIWDATYYSIAESLYPIFLALVVFILPYSKITEAAIIFAIVDLLQRSITPVKDVSSKIANIQRAYSGLFRIDEFLGHLDESWSSENRKSGGTKEFHQMNVDIDTFKYPKRNEQESQFAIKDIHFEAHKGELFGVVGLSGSGKSTLLNIIAGNIISQDAKITLTDTSGDKILFPGDSLDSVISYREQVGIVSQDSHIFSESLKFNITMGEEECDEKFNEFWNWIVEKIPYFTTWGVKPEDILNQKNLSMGQKQLLAGVRACYLKKPVILFDEISSGLDGELELALRELVLLVQNQSLTFIVAHRLETVIESDTILVMEDGKVIDRGQHSDLMGRCVVYQEFLAELGHSVV